MITEQDLQAAIAECRGKRNPDANTCIKLAAFLIIQEHLYPSVQPTMYSYAPPPEQAENRIEYESDTDFGRAVNGKLAADVWPVMDELMDAVHVLQPRLYASVLNKLEEI